MNPLLVYQKMLHQGDIEHDLLQNQVILAFDDLYQDLTHPKKNWFFKAKVEFHGLYIHGSVGRGKTFLMDLFANCIAKNSLRRQHFHAFMHWFHQQLRTIKNQQNPIDLVIQDLSKSTSILCLDEFLVHDITDAMLLAGILFALEKHKISLVTTSNVNPRDLYVGGLQRKKFIPAIEWMQKTMNIIQLDGQYDYRSTQLSTQTKWLTPINDETTRIFEQTFSQLIASNNIQIDAITINKRLLNTKKHTSNHIMFEFDTLCKQPRNANDFIQLSHKYQSIFLVINELNPIDDRNIAWRFITLVDVLYDTKTPLYVLSEVAFSHLYTGSELAFEMQRTVSRLTEMQNDF